MHLVEQACKTSTEDEAHDDVAELDRRMFIDGREMMVDDG